VAVSAEHVSEAIILWTGFGVDPLPLASDERVTAHFGSEAAQALLPVVHHLAEVFYATDARHVAPNVQEMGDRAAEQFRQAHPEISEQATRALAWSYTFDFR